MFWIYVLEKIQCLQIINQIHKQLIKYFYFEREPRMRVCFYGRNNELYSKKNCKSLSKLNVNSIRSNQITNKVCIQFQNIQWTRTLQNHSY